MAAALLSSASAHGREETALDCYVAASDPNYHYQLINTVVEHTYTAYVLELTSRPRLAWTFEDNGSLRVKTETKPEIMRLWQAHNPDARDFRLETIGRAYSDSVLKDQGDGVYVATAPDTEQGWTACFVKLTFPSAGANPDKFTTGVRIAPDRLPFGPPPEEEAAVPRSGAAGDKR